MNLVLKEGDGRTGLALVSSYPGFFVHIGDFQELD